MGLHVYNTQYFRQTCDSNKSVQIWRKVILRQKYMVLYFEAERECLCVWEGMIDVSRFHWSSILFLETQRDSVWLVIWPQRDSVWLVIWPQRDSVWLVIWPQRDSVWLVIWPHPLHVRFKTLRTCKELCYISHLMSHTLTTRTSSQVTTA